MKLGIFPLLMIIFCINLESCAQKIPVVGVASYYHHKFEGKKTASGAIFSNDKLTAAHKTLPFGTVVLLTSLKNGKQVRVTINDRLPTNSTRLIDLSVKAAKELDMIQSGLAQVSMEIIETP